MGDVDIADQLRGSYQFDIWIKNRKWWWSLLFWGLGVILMNAYITYKVFNEEEGVSKSGLLTQYEFRKAIALHWINPEHAKNRKSKEEYPFRYSVLAYKKGPTGKGGVYSTKGRFPTVKSE